MKTAITKRFLLLLPLLLAGCETGTEPESADPDEFTGSYTLVGIGGAAVPVTVDQVFEAGHQVNVVIADGSMTLNVDGTLEQTTRTRHFVVGTDTEVMDETATRRGTWKTDVEQIDVTWEGMTIDDTTYLYDGITGELSLLMDDPAAVWRYRKND